MKTIHALCWNRWRAVLTAAGLLWMPCFTFGQGYTGWWTDHSGVNHYGPPPAARATESWTPAPQSTRTSRVIPPAIVKVEPPSWQQQAQQRSRSLNNDGLARMRREDYAGAMICFGEALRQWAGNTEAHGNLMAAQEQLRVQFAQTQAQREKEENWARGLQEHNQRVISEVTRQFGQAVAKRRAEELSRKMQKTKATIDGILGRLSAELEKEKAGGGGSGSPPSDPGSDFASVSEEIAPPHLNPMVVDARHAKGETVATAPAQRRAASAPVNPRTHVLLDAIVEGGKDWGRIMNVLKAKVVADPSNMAAMDAFHFTIGFTSGINFNLPRFPSEGHVYSLPDDSVQAFRAAAQPHIREGRAALVREDFEAAHRAFVAAHEADPTHLAIRNFMSWTEGLAASQDVEPPDLFSQPELVALLVEESVMRGNTKADAPSKGFWDRVAGFFR